MIGYLNGKVIDTDGKKAIIAVDSGVGYEVNFGYFLNRGQTTEVFIHHHISENDQSLWGFQSLEDKRMFELLKTVNKVGSSKAYPLITTIGTPGLIEAILMQHIDVLTKAPGIGKKMAEQIILSLKDKIENFQQSTGIVASDSLLNNESQESLDSQVMQEAILALESLGYKDKEVGILVRKHLQAYPEDSSASIIKSVLRDL